MDVHVELSYCTFPMFQQFCISHLQTERHQRLEEVRQLLANGHQMTPALVAGTMHEHRRDVDAAFDQLISNLVASKIAA